MTEISVTVGLSSKVANPNNQYENVTFTRSFSHKEVLAPRPEEKDKQEAYDEFISARRDEIEGVLKFHCEESIQNEIDEFYLAQEEVKKN